MQTNPTDCIFCKIASGEIKSHIVYEDDKVISFPDIEPFTHGHILVVPKEHYEDFYDLDDELYDHIFRVVRKLARAVKKKYSPKKVVVLISGFDLDHVHIHILPSSEGGDITSAKRLEGELKKLTPEELEEVKDEIKEVL